MTNSSTGTSTQIVQKLWNYCNVLRDDLSACDAQAGGMSYGDYVEQLTYLLFLTMAAERDSLVESVVS